MVGVTECGYARGEGLPHVDNKFLNVNINNFENLDKHEGGGWSDNVDKVILLNFETFLMRFFGHLNKHLVVFSLYLTIRKKLKKLIHRNLKKKYY